LIVKLARNQIPSHSRGSGIPGDAISVSARARSTRTGRCRRLPN